MIRAIVFDLDGTLVQWASERIASTYRRFYDLFVESREGVAETP